ncbi:MAG: hypothetical protein KDA52_06465 [Planctomycetaceae bacterium]|nr:hypothetical protein [Planctomycetaceae bacterium]
MNFASSRPGNLIRTRYRRTLTFPLSQFVQSAELTLRGGRLMGEKSTRQPQNREEAEDTSTSLLIHFYTSAQSLQTFSADIRD